MFRTLLSLLLVFTLVSCNDAKISEADIPKQAQIALSAESPLGQFLASSNKSAVIKFYAEWCSTCEKYEHGHRTWPTTTHWRPRQQPASNSGIQSSS